jgi:hypothetical protein
MPGVAQLSVHDCCLSLCYNTCSDSTQHLPVVPAALYCLTHCERIWFRVAALLQGKKACLVLHSVNGSFCTEDSCA